MNFVRGSIERQNGQALFSAPGFSLPLAHGSTTQSGPVVLGVRPHDLSLAGASENGPRGVVTLVEPLGSEQLVYVSVPGGADLVAAIGADQAPRVDDTVGLRVEPQAVHLFDPDNGGRLALG